MADTLSRRDFLKISALSALGIAANQLPRLELPNLTPESQIFNVVAFSETKVGRDIMPNYLNQDTTKYKIYYDKTISTAEILNPKLLSHDPRLTEKMVSEIHWIKNSEEIETAIITFTDGEVAVCGSDKYNEPYFHYINLPGTLMDCDVLNNHNVLFIVDCDENANKELFVQLYQQGRNDIYIHTDPEFTEIINPPLLYHRDRFDFESKEVVKIRNGIKNGYAFSSVHDSNNLIYAIDIVNGVSLSIFTNDEINSKFKKVLDIEPSDTIYTKIREIYSPFIARINQSDTALFMTLWSSPSEENIKEPLDFVVVDNKKVISSQKIRESELVKIASLSNHVRIDFESDSASINRYSDNSNLNLPENANLVTLRCDMNGSIQVIPWIILEKLPTSEYKITELMIPSEIKSFLSSFRTNNDPISKEI